MDISLTKDHCRRLTCIGVNWIPMMGMDEGIIVGSCCPFYGIEGGGGYAIERAGVTEETKHRMVS